MCCYIVCCYIVSQLKETKQKFVTLKKSQQHAEKIRLDESKKTGTNGNINMAELQVGMIHTACW